MSADSYITDFLIDAVNNKGNQSLYLRLYDNLREAIVSGRLRPGTKIPSSRQLAQELGISRNTVLNAFDKLIAEGYFTTKQGSGTYVEEDFSDELVRNEIEKSSIGKTSEVKISKRGENIKLNSYDFPFATNKAKPFALSLATEDNISYDIWKRLATNNLQKKKSLFFQYNEPFGYLPLREAISQYVEENRGIKCDSSQIIITSGSQQGIDLTARMLFDNGEKVWIEDPAYPGTFDALRAAGAEIFSIPLDEEGLDLKFAEGISATPQAIYVTPSSHFPLGRIMSFPRRLEILEWAERENVWIVEDDEGSEFRYQAKPIIALKGIDSRDRVIYLGTFTRLLFNSLRLGFLVIPRKLIQPFRRAISVTTSHPSILDQITLCDFIRDGHFNRHIHRIRAVYAEKKEFLIKLLENELGKYLEIGNVDSGMNLVCYLKNGIREINFAKAAFEQGIHITPLSAFCINVKLPEAVLFGFTSITNKEMINGVKSLKKVFERILL